jgi:hypothetical protein
MMKTVKNAVPVLLSALLFPAAAHAQTPAGSLSDCQAIQDRLARYACYDSWDTGSGAVVRPAPRATTSSSAGNAAPQAATTTPATRSAPSGDAVADFGRQQSTTRVVDGEEGAELIGTVAALEQLGPNLWVVTLDGGQRWRQMLTKRYALQAGDEVRIYPTKWGSSYRLTAKRIGGYIQVERVDAGAVASGEPLPGARVPTEAEAARDEGPSLLGRLLRRDRERDDEMPTPQPALAGGAATSSNADPVENFGRQARVVQGEDGKAELVDTVSSLEQLGPNLWVVSLEGGQRWRQMLSKRYTLQAGDEVHIYPTKWGSSYRLTAKRLGGYIQVERID